MVRTKVSRALLCGWRVRFAWSMAALTSVSSMRTAKPFTCTVGRSCGTRSRSAMALATTCAMRRSPLSLAASGVSVAVALMPGMRSAMVRLTTPVSPSEGSTWSM